MLQPVGHVTHVILLQIYQTEGKELATLFFLTRLMTSILSNKMFEFHGGVLAMFLLTSCKDDDLQDKTWYNLDT